MTIAPGTRFGRYEIRSRIGAGGMGEVYLAQDTEPDRKVALKILPADVATNQDRLKRFTQEARAAAALNHPNIARIYEIGESDGMTESLIDSLSQLPHLAVKARSSIFRYKGKEIDPQKVALELSFKIWCGASNIRLNHCLR